MAADAAKTSTPLPSWRVCPDDDRDVQVWDGSAWVFDCCTRTAAEAAQCVADNIAEFEEVHGR